MLVGGFEKDNDKKIGLILHETDPEAVLSLSPASRSRLRNSRFGLDFLSGHANSLTLLLPTTDEQRRNQTLNSDSPIRSRSQRTSDEASDHRARSGMPRCPKAKPGKQRKAHDESGARNRVRREALVGSSTSNEPTWQTH